MTVSRQDPRIWTPDASCAPVNLEFAVADADRLMGRFSVPRGHVLVIRSLSSGQTPSFLTKSQCRVIIARGQGVTTDDLRAVPVHGALTNVEELSETGGGITGTNRTGFVLPLGPFTRPVCIVLPGGEIYELIKVGTSATTSFVFVAFHGWVFRDSPRP